MSDWHPLGSVDPARLRDARLQLHHAVQLLAAFGQTHVEARADDSHRALGWDGPRERFWSQTAEDGVRVALVLDPLELVVARHDEEASGLRLLGTTINTARAWLAKAVAKVRGHEEEPLAWPEYDIPEHDITSGRPFQPRPAAVREVGRWFSNAQALLQGWRDTGVELSEEFTWPHHFDLAAFATLARDEDGKPSRTVGFGVSPGDDGVEEPYLYVNAWPTVPADQMPDLEDPATTKSDGWSGYALTGTELLSWNQDPRASVLERGRQQSETAHSFVQRATAAATAALEQAEDV